MTLRDDGNYRCVATNDAGTATTKAVLRIEGKHFGAHVLVWVTVIESSFRSSCKFRPTWIYGTIIRSTSKRCQSARRKYNATRVQNRWPTIAGSDLVQGWGNSSTVR